MDKDLSLGDIISELSSKIYTQNYSKKPQIEGVKIVDLKNFISEDGNFSEILRLKEGEAQDFPGFKISQINKSKLNPNSVKAWHLHLRQDEIWYVAAGQLVLGLWDVRKDSSTSDTKMRIVLGQGSNKLVFIPKGVAHGCSNYSNKPSQILYFVSEQFNVSNPDEKRIPWNTLGEDFWKPQKD